MPGRGTTRVPTSRTPITLRYKLRTLLILLAVLPPLLGVAWVTWQPQRRTVQAKLRGEWREFDVRVPREEQLRKSFGIQWTMFKPAARHSPSGTDAA